jgi:hypothetical protein
MSAGRFDGRLFHFETLSLFILGLDPGMRRGWPVKPDHETTEGYGV